MDIGKDRQPHIFLRRIIAHGLAPDLMDIKHQATSRDAIGKEKPAHAAMAAGMRESAWQDKSVLARRFQPLEQQRQHGVDPRGEPGSFHSSAWAG